MRSRYFSKLVLGVGHVSANINGNGKQTDESSAEFHSLLQEQENCNNSEVQTRSRQLKMKRSPHVFYSNRHDMTARQWAWHLLIHALHHSRT